jgi:hypothetical protein
MYHTLILLQIYKSKEKGLIFACDVKEKKGSLDSFGVPEVSGYQG